MNLLDHIDRHPGRLIATNGIILGVVGADVLLNLKALLGIVLLILSVCLTATSLYRKWFGRRMRKLIVREILIIDDDQQDLQFYAKAFSRINCHVTTRMRFEGAIETLESSHRLDMVLLDARMPDHEPCEMYRRIRIIRPELPVVIFSGAELTQDTVGRILRVGPAIIALKTEDFDEFARTIIETLRLGQPV